MRGATVMLALVVVLVAAPAWADFKTGKEAYYRSDYDTALKEWWPLAEQGEAKPQNALGVLSREGKGVPQDFQAALRWFRLAAEQGYAGGQYNLGMMYENGRGVPKNYVQAHMWVALAAAQRHENARRARGRLAARMTPAQLADAQRLAREWTPKPE